MPHRKAISQSGVVVVLGSAARNILEACKDIYHRGLDLDQLRYQMVFIGFECLPVVLALTIVGVMIITTNTAHELSNHGGRELIGSLVAISAFREVVPVFAAFAVAARCGTAMTAEISTMKVTEQVDALRVLKANPSAYLLAPKLIAAFLVIPFLLPLANIVSLIAGMLVCNASVGLEPSLFLDGAWKAISFKEYLYPIIKAECFTLFAILTNVTLGLGCEGGAKEVGLVTTRAATWVMIGIIILDGVLTPMLYR